MELIKCDKTHSEKVTELYHRTIRYLEENINYPKWSEEHPSDCNIQAAIISGTQYACIDKEKIPVISDNNIININPATSTADFKEYIK